MIPTVGSVKQLTRDLLGDTEVASGQEFPDSYLHKYLQLAYEELITALEISDNPFTRRHSHFNLPAYQTILFPQQAGILDFGEPKDVYERRMEGTVNITAVTPAPTLGYCDITVDAAHGRADGDTILLYGITDGLTDDINWEWGVLSTGAQTLRLLGCLASGTWSAGGIVTWSNDNWPTSPLKKILDPLYIPRTPTSELGFYSWYRDAFHFSPSTEIRQLKIVHSTSGQIPSSKFQSLYIDGSEPYLGYRTASLAGPPKGAIKAAKYAKDALGPDMDINNPEGHLGKLIAQGIKTMQQEEFVPQPYRQRRSTGLPSSYGYY